jgi:polysaccharide export outer membrane protein
MLASSALGFKRRRPTDTPDGGQPFGTPYPARHTYDIGEGVSCRGQCESIVVAAVLSVLTVPACWSQPRPYNYASEPDPIAEEYVLGPSDVLRVNVWHNTEFAGDVIIRPDGTISLPLLGDLRAAGRTPGQLRADIAARLTAFIKDDSAIVTVSVSAVNSYRFVVSGNVEHSGVFTASHYVRVTEAIALAGGPNRFANPETSVIIRPNADPKLPVRRIPIDYVGILEGTHPEQNLRLLPGDTVYVP